MLSFPKNWCIQMCTLYERAKVESKSMRRVERSLMQLEVMDSLFYNKTNSKIHFILMYELKDIFASFKSHEPKGKDRIQFFYSVSCPPFWTVQVNCSYRMCAIV